MLIREGLSSQQEPGLPPQECRFGTGPAKISTEAKRLGKYMIRPLALGMIKEDLRPIPSHGWAEMIRKVCEVDPMLCPRCGGKMRVIAFLTDYSVVDRSIDHLKLTIVAQRHPPTHPAHQEVLMAAETAADYSW